MPVRWCATARPSAYRTYIRSRTRCKFKPQPEYSPRDGQVGRPEAAPFDGRCYGVPPADGVPYRGDDATSRRLDARDIRCDPRPVCAGLRDGACRYQRRGMQAATEYVRIPMCGMVESLNVSASAAILIYILSSRMRETGCWMAVVRGGAPAAAFPVAGLVGARCLRDPAPTFRRYAPVRDQVRTDGVRFRLRLAAR